jgi:hypothetical protein
MAAMTIGYSRDQNHMPTNLPDPRDQAQERREMYFA